MSDLGELGGWALVAGGSDGLGAAFAGQIAAAGLDLVLVARREETLRDTAEALRARHGVEVRTISADLTRPDAVERIAAATADIEIGLLVCNAGSESSFGDFLDDPDLARLDGVVALNILAPAALVHHFGQSMRARRRGGIVLIGSMAGFAGSPRIAAYAAAKSFIHTFAEGLWEELRGSNVMLVAFVLGAANTPTMRRTIGFEIGGLADPEALAAEALNNLGAGPIYVTRDKRAEEEALRSLPRSEAVARTAAGAALLRELIEKGGAEKP